MTYEVVDNFAAGLDVRKSALTAPGGSMLRLTNAIITPGGEIQKRRAFEVWASVPGSLGLAANDREVYVFGRNTTPVVPFSPPGPPIRIIGSLIPDASTSYSQTDFTVYKGGIYVVFYDPGNEPRHFYQQSRVVNSFAETQGTGKGSFVRTFKNKVYACNHPYDPDRSTVLYFSASGNPMIWTPVASPINGAGQTNLGVNDLNSEPLTSLEVYYDKLAVFSRTGVQIWAMAHDDAQNAFTQILRGAGAYAPNSALQYGDGDIMFLDLSGIRSLKAKDSSNSASASDIGSPVDALMQRMQISPGPLYAQKAVALLEPSVGRLWMCFPNEIFVLSHFPGPGITAWSRLTLPFTMTYAVTCGGQMIFRDDADQLWLYGGLDGATYDNCGVEVRMPYLSGKKPGHNKIYHAIDVTTGVSASDYGVTQGNWTAKVSYDYLSPDTEESVGTFSAPTWRGGRAELNGQGSHISLRFYNNDAYKVTLSNFAVHYSVADDEA